MQPILPNLAVPSIKQQIDMGRRRPPLVPSILPYSDRPTQSIPGVTQIFGPSGIDRQQMLGAALAAITAADIAHSKQAVRQQAHIENIQTLNNWATNCSKQVPTHPSHDKALLGALLVGGGLVALERLAAQDKSTRRATSLAHWRTLSDAAKESFFSQYEDMRILILLLDALAHGRMVFPASKQGSHWVDTLFAATLHGSLAGLRAAALFYGAEKALQIKTIFAPTLGSSPLWANDVCMLPWRPTDESVRAGKRRAISPPPEERPPVRPPLPEAVPVPAVFAPPVRPPMPEAAPVPGAFVYPARAPLPRFWKPAPAPTSIGLPARAQNASTTSSSSGEGIAPFDSPNTRGSSTEASSTSMRAGSSLIDLSSSDHSLLRLPTPAQLVPNFAEQLRSMDPVPLYSPQRNASALVPRAALMQLLRPTLLATASEKMFPVKIGSITTEQNLFGMHAWLHAPDA